MTDFADKLATLCAAELSLPSQSLESRAAMIERLAAVLGFTIAVAAAGQAQAIDALVAGAEAHMHAEAVRKAPLGRAMAEIAR